MRGHEVRDLDERRMDLTMANVSLSQDNLVRRLPKRERTSIEFFKTLILSPERRWKACYTASRGGVGESPYNEKSPVRNLFVKACSSRR